MVYIFEVWCGSAKAWQPLSLHKEEAFALRELDRWKFHGPERVVSNRAPARVTTYRPAVVASEYGGGAEWQAKEARAGRY
jgi:hypothetical protein